MLRARDVMTKDVVWLNQNKPIREAYNFLKTFSIHHLPIVDDNSRLVGLLSEKDFLRVGHLQENELDLPDHPGK